MTTIYRVLVIDEEESRLERRFLDIAWAIEFANKCRWASISV